MTVRRTPTTVDGAPATAVVNRLYAGSRLLKTTRQRFSQDAAGNVWVVTARGSRPTPFLPAHPQTGVSRTLFTEHARFPLDPSLHGLVDFHRGIGNTQDQTPDASYQLSLWSVSPLP